MFVGHFALAFAAKRATPRVSLATLILAAQWADIVWPVLLAFGIEQVRIEPGNTAFTPLDFVSYPYSHSLAALVVWGVLIGVGYRAMVGGRRTSWLLAALVVSHWVLDYLTHRPDLPIYPGGPKVGLGLWNSVPATLTVELLLYGAGLAVYLRTTRARDRIGRWAFLAFVVFLLVIYLGSSFGPPPTSVQSIWLAAIVVVPLLMLWAWWADRHRDTGGN
jgi:hypothetical protein